MAKVEPPKLFKILKAGTSEDHRHKSYFQKEFDDSLEIKEFTSISLRKFITAFINFKKVPLS